MAGSHVARQLLLSLELFVVRVFSIWLCLDSIMVYPSGQLGCSNDKTLKESENSFHPMAANGIPVYSLRVALVQDVGHSVN